jgi:CheY-like chemotaxis protein
MSRTIVAVVDDLFFASRIRGTGEQAGARVLFARTGPDVIQKIRDEEPALIVADLNVRSCDPIELAKALKTDECCSAVPLLGFFSHVQTELQQAAKDAGFDRVMPRSLFNQKLLEILAGRESI